MVRIRDFCGIAVFVVGLQLVSVASAQTGSNSATLTGRPSSGRVATLQQQLEKGLRCRRPIEFEYVQNVALLVKQKKLPLKLVQGSFDYARRRGHRHYPFQYFRRVLELRTARLGLVVSPAPVRR